MMPITHDDLDGVSETVGRRVLARARVIAPCLDTLEGEAAADAIAILQGVAAEIPEAGSRRTRSMSRNGTSVSLGDVGAAFAPDDIASLRALCGLASSSAAPRGSFPEPSRTVRRVWPERHS